MRKWLNPFIISLFAISITSSCTNSGSSVAGYSTSPNGLQYKLIKTSGGNKGILGEYVKYSSALRTLKGDLIFSSKNSGSDLYGCIIKPRHKADPLEILTMMGAGDSASMVIPESEFFAGDVPLPASVQKGDNVMLDLKIYKIYTPQQYTDSILPTLKQPAGFAERKRIEDFIASKGWKADRTPSGLYIVVDNPGTGPALQNGKKVTMNYTGTLLDGTKFDSNVDPSFNHVSPFSFTLGQGQVIKGWDEGVPHFKVGGKGKLIIPSNLGYGDQAQAKIPAGSTLVFDIEVLGVTDAPPVMPQQPIQINPH